MAVFFCPNLSDPQVKKDFDSLVSSIGENKAYYYWHKYEGDMSKINAELNNNLVKEGVDFVFTENPELSEIGTKEQYSNYLDTIFPHSKVKDIVYHETSKHSKEKILEQGFKTPIEKDLELGKDSLIWFSAQKNYYRTKNTTSIFAILNSIFPKIDNHEHFERAGDASGIRNIDLEMIGADAIITEKYADEDLPPLNYLSEDFVNPIVFAAVIKSEQIHILGSKQDIEGFKKFVNKKSNIITTPTGTFELNDLQMKQYQEMIQKYGADRAKELITDFIDANDLKKYHVEPGKTNALNKASNRSYSERLEEAKEKYGSLVDNGNNPYVWDLERHYNLLSEDSFKEVDPKTGFKKKIYRPIIYSAAKKLADKIKKEHPELGVNVTQVSGTGSVKGIVKIFFDLSNYDHMYDYSKHERNILQAKFRIQEGYNIPRSILKPLGLTKDINPESAELMDFIKIHTNANELLIHLKDNYDLNSPSLERILDLLLLNGETNSKLKVEIDNSMSALGQYIPKINTIVLNEKFLTKADIFSLKQVIRTILHEYIHAYTSRAIDDPITKEDKEFRAEVVKLYNIVKKNSNIIDNALQYGLTNENEFLAELFTNPDFKEYVVNHKYNVWQRFLNALRKLFKFPPKINKEEDPLFNEFVSYLETSNDVTHTGNLSKEYNMPIKDVIYNLRETLDIDNRNEFVRQLTEFGKQFEFNELGTIHKPTGFSILPTTKVMNQFGFGIDEDELQGSEELQEIIKRAQSLGKVVHGVAESIITGVKANTKNELGFTYTTEFRNAIVKILDKFQGQKITVMSEVFVADLRKAVGGKIDMVVIDEKNQIHIYDFKTKEKGFDQYDTKFINDVDGSVKFSSKEAAHAQLSIYKQLFEETTGYPVHDMNVILIEPTIKDSVLTNAKLSNDYNGVDSFDVVSELGEKIYNSITNINVGEESILSKIKSDTGHISKLTEERLKTLSYKNLNLSAEHEAVNKLIASLQYKLKTAIKAGDSVKVQDTREQLDEVLKIDDQLEALKAILLRGLNETANISRQYTNMKEAGKNITLNRLKYWKEFVSAYDSFGPYAQWLAENITKFGDVKNLERKRMSKILDDIHLLQERVTFVKNLYETEGRNKLVKFLKPLYNRFKAEARNEAIKAYRKLSPSEKKDYKDEQDFVTKYLKEANYDIDIRTEELLNSEITSAARDISTLGMWLDNVLDSRDPIVAAIVKAVGKADWMSNITAIKTKDKIIEALREFEKEYKPSAITDPKQIYSFMLEHNEQGEVTGYLMDKFHSSLYEDYNLIVKNTRIISEKSITELIENGNYNNINSVLKHYLEEIKKNPKNIDLQEEARDEIRKVWKDEVTVFDKTKFKRAKLDFIESLKDIDSEEGGINEKEYNQLVRLEETFGRKNPTTVNDLANLGEITYETANTINNWVFKNAWSYRDIKSEYEGRYVNKEYDKLISLSDKDPKKHLYLVMKDLIQEANNMLPYGSRIGLRLPGVYKTRNEMLKAGDGILKSFTERAARQFNVRPDDKERDNKEMVDINGNPKYFLPIHYTGKVDADMQSYDVPTIIFKFWQSANDYSLKSEILPEVELAKYFIDNRYVDPVSKKKINPSLAVSSKNREELRKRNSNLAVQFNEWMLMFMYGMPKKDQGKINLPFGMSVDVAKLVDSMNSFTSLNFLGVNLIQGVANTALGEALQMAENIAGEYMSKAAYARGTKFYMGNMPGFISDIGKRSPDNIASILMEEFNVLNEEVGASFSRRHKYRNLLNTNTLYFTTHAGEHEMQGRFLFSLLSDKKAYDKDGKELGNMLEMYVAQHTMSKKEGMFDIEVNGNKLHRGFGDLPAEVDLIKSEWTQNDKFEFYYKLKGILSRLHGEYSEIGKVAIQRGAVGRMAFMFRKFVVPGFKRRWAREDYIERLGDFVEGSYISTGKFLGQLMGDLKHFQFQVGQHWNNLSDHQKANVKRTITEVAFLAMTIILSNFAIKKLKDLDDDNEERMWSFLAYQAIRLRAELLFYVLPNQAWSILRSPAASMSMIESLIKLFGQMGDPTEKYVRGPWKGHYKWEKYLMNVTPGYRQFYRLRDMQDQLSWFSSSVRKSNNSSSQGK